MTHDCCYWHLQTRENEAQYDAVKHDGIKCIKTRTFFFFFSFETFIEDKSKNGMYKHSQDLPC